MRQLTGLLPDELKQEIYGLWEVFSIPAVCGSWMKMELMWYLSDLQEYETQRSPEARLVKEFDLLEMILQAYEYEELERTPGRLQEFFDSTNGISLFSHSLEIFAALPSLVLLVFRSFPPPRCAPAYQISEWTEGASHDKSRRCREFWGALGSPWSCTFVHCCTFNTCLQLLSA